MEEKEAANKKIERLVAEINRTYMDDRGINFIDTANLPVRDKIIEILDLFMELLFPGYTGKRTVTQENVNYIVGDIVCQIGKELREQIERAYRYRCRMENCDTGGCGKAAKEVVENMKISADTTEKLDQPFIPEETYIELANQYWDSRIAHYQKS